MFAPLMDSIIPNIDICILTLASMTDNNQSKGLFVYKDNTPPKSTHTHARAHTRILIQG